MEVGFFAPRFDDPARAIRLSNGQLDIGETTLDIRSPELFDMHTDLPRASYLELHSLRWLDVLRRTQHTLEIASSTWESVVGLWIKSSSARDLNSEAWSRFPLEQRCTLIALSECDLRMSTKFIQLHLDKLNELDKRLLLAEHRLPVFDLRIGLMVRKGDSRLAIQSAAEQFVRRVYSEDGYAISKDLNSLEQVTLALRSRLLDLEFDHTHWTLQAIQNEEFWIHATAPNGSLVPVGDKLPDNDRLFDSPAMSYVQTEGASGTPPRNALSFFANGPRLHALRMGGD